MLLISLLILVVASALNKLTLSNKHISRLSILSLIYSVFISYETFNISLKNGFSIFNNLFHVSMLTQLFDLVILIFGILILFLTSSYAFNNVSLFKNNNLESNTYYPQLLKFNSINKNILSEYSIICLFSLLGNSIFLTSNDLISIFLGIELLSYSLYILSSIFKNSYAGTKQGLTYFLLGSLASILILFGSSLIYILTGLTNLEDLSIIYTYSYYNYSLQIGLIFICAGLLFKIGASPFHNWSPDVYDGVPTIVTTWISTIHKVGILLVIYQLVHLFYNPVNLNNLLLPEFINNIDNFYWIYILIIGSLLSMLIGSVSGVGQLDYVNGKSRLKRILAFSGITNTGYLLLALIANTSDSLVSYIVYIIQYTFSNINMFMIIILLGYLLYFNNNMKIDKYSPVQYLHQLKGFFWTNSYLTMCFQITLFSFVGIPPLLGFYSKYMIIFSTVNSGLYILTTLLIICSVVSGYYYLTIVRYLLIKNTNKDVINNNVKSLIVISPTISYVISILTLIILLYSIYPTPFLQGAHIVAMFEYYY